MNSTKFENLDQIGQQLLINATHINPLLKAIQYNNEQNRNLSFQNINFAQSIFGYNQDGFIYSNSFNTSYYLNYNSNCGKGSLNYDPRCQQWYIQSINETLSSFQEPKVFEANNNSTLTQPICQRLLYYNDAIQKDEINHVFCYFIPLNQFEFILKDYQKIVSKQFLVDPKSQTIIYNSSDQFNYTSITTIKQNQFIDDDDKVFISNTIKQFQDDSVNYKYKQLNLNSIVDINFNSTAQWKVIDGQNFFIIISPVYIIDKLPKYRGMQYRYDSYKFQSILAYLNINIISDHYLKEKSEEVLEYTRNLLIFLSLGLICLFIISIMITIYYTNRMNNLLHAPINRLLFILRRLQKQKEFNELHQILFLDNNQESEVFLSKETYDLYQSFQMVFQQLFYFSQNYYNCNQQENLIRLNHNVSFFTSFQNYYALGITHNNIGSILMNQQRYFEALEHFQKSIIYARYEIQEFCVNNPKSLSLQYLKKHCYIDSIFNDENKYQNYEKLSQNQAQSPLFETNRQNESSIKKQKELNEDQQSNKRRVTLDVFGYKLYKEKDENKEEKEELLRQDEHYEKRISLILNLYYRNYNYLFSLITFQKNEDSQIQYNKSVARNKNYFWNEIKSRLKELLKICKELHMTQEQEITIWCNLLLCYQRLDKHKKKEQLKEKIDLLYSSLQQESNKVELNLSSIKKQYIKQVSFAEHKKIIDDILIQKDSFQQLNIDKSKVKQNQTQQFLTVNPQIIMKGNDKQSNQLKIPEFNLQITRSSQDSFSPLNIDHVQKNIEDKKSQSNFQSEIDDKNSRNNSYFDQYSLQIQQNNNNNEKKNIQFNQKPSISQNNINKSSIFKNQQIQNGQNSFHEQNSFNSFTQQNNTIVDVNQNNQADKNKYNKQNQYFNIQKQKNKKNINKVDDLANNQNGGYDQYDEIMQSFESIKKEFNSIKKKETKIQNSKTLVLNSGIIKDLLYAISFIYDNKFYEGVDTLTKILENNQRIMTHMNIMIMVQIKSVFLMHKIYSKDLDEFALKFNKNNSFQVYMIVQNVEQNINIIQTHSFIKQLLQQVLNKENDKIGLLLSKYQERQINVLINLIRTKQIKSFIERLLDKIFECFSDQTNQTHEKLQSFENVQKKYQYQENIQLTQVLANKGQNINKMQYIQNNLSPINKNQENKYSTTRNKRQSLSESYNNLYNSIHIYQDIFSEIELLKKQEQDNQFKNIEDKQDISKSHQKLDKKKDITNQQMLNQNSISQPLKMFYKFQSHDGDDNIQSDETYSENDNVRIENDNVRIENDNIRIENETVEQQIFDYNYLFHISVRKALCDLISNRDIAFQKEKYKINQIYSQQKQKHRQQSEQLNYISNNDQLDLIFKFIIFQTNEIQILHNKLFEQLCLILTNLNIQLIIYSYKKGQHFLEASSEQSYKYQDKEIIKIFYETEQVINYISSKRDPFFKQNSVNFIQHY